MKRFDMKYVSFLIIAAFIAAVIFAPVSVAAAGNDAEGVTEAENGVNDAVDGDENGKGQPELASFDELNGKTVSMLTGAPFEEKISSKAPDVKEFTYYTSMADMILGLKSHKTDAGLMNNAVAALAINKDSGLALFPENLGESTFGIAFKKGDERCPDWQAAYEKIPKETIDELWDKWTGADESVKVMMEQDWPGEAGSVTVAACDTLQPMSYVGEGGERCGFDCEIILLMAKELDIHVTFTGMDFAAALAAVESGKSDLACGSIVVTDERKEKMDFVDYYPAAFVLIVRSAEAEVEDASVWSSVKSSFEKTFVREDRYKLFISGILITILITVLSIIFGTVLGFLLYMACRNGNKAANTFAKFFVWLIQGMPVVVLLMILYYVIFGKTEISGTVVSIVAFSFVFGAGVFGMLKTGVGAIDKGQKEAALALGYSDIRSFFRIILPQAVPHFLPAYKGEMISLVKATAIVGYIAVQDLTKMGDIVRGRTYEPFFPLISVAVIYFILGALMTFLIGKLEIGINPKRRKREDILKGVDTDD